jgi:hypothetical protein
MRFGDRAQDGLPVIEELARQLAQFLVAVVPAPPAQRLRGRISCAPKATGASGGQDRLGQLGGFN